MQTSRWQGVPSFLLALLLNGSRMYFFYSPSEYERTSLPPSSSLLSQVITTLKGTLETTWNLPRLLVVVLCLPQGTRAVDVHIITISLFAYGGLIPLLLTGAPRPLLLPLLVADNACASISMHGYVIVQQSTPFGPPPSSFITRCLPLGRGDLPSASHTR